MSESRWLELTDLCGKIGFSTSIFSNSLLLFLICGPKTTNRQIGSYRNLLIFFSIFTVFYSCVEILLRPLIHIYDDTLFLIQRKRFESWGKLATRLVPTTYCGCYAMSFTIFALQFTHRFIATCKPHSLHYFDGKWFFVWIFAAFSIACSWAAAAFFLFPQTARTFESFKFVMNHNYGINESLADYVPYKYFYYDELAVKKPDIKNMLGVCQHLLVILFSYTILFYCGTRTYLELQKFRGISTKTRDLQLQLFRALVVQTTFPMIFMYFPTGFMFACPFFGLELGATTNYQTIVAQLYPGIDPLILIFLIDGYRNTIKNWIFCRRNASRENSSYHEKSRRISPSEATNF
ncbi:unnamed protein product [Caenorhabditis angaria]|uniref:Serpentine receptor class r-10 n=1 Tax=Caenorhabditis angaria TaxID=860376 RepID=A0A9P1ISB8_9PELO|nr:unnamed protein product [Caenorhabditis angaria]